MTTAVWIAVTVLLVAIACYLALWFGVDGNGEFFFMWICVWVAMGSLTALAFLGMVELVVGDGNNTHKLESFVEWVTGEPLPPELQTP